jgi:hypothetical protein
LNIPAATAKPLSVNPLLHSPRFDQLVLAQTFPDPKHKRATKRIDFPNSANGQGGIAKRGTEKLLERLYVEYQLGTTVVRAVEIRLSTCIITSTK